MRFGNNQQCLSCQYWNVVALPEDFTQGSPATTPPSGKFKYTCRSCGAENIFSGAAGKLTQPLSECAVATQLD